MIVSDRGLRDTADVFTCLDAATGKARWTYRTPAEGNLDYGNSPRATPVISGTRAFVAGAFGHVAALDLATGKPVWELSFKDEYEPTDDRKWGHCATPLLVDDRLVLTPGAKDASVVAVNPETAKTVWASPGKPWGYGSPVACTLGGVRQLVGFDRDSLGGWNPATGKRLWRIVPEKPNDFNVPTPIPAGPDALIVSTENNGTRRYRFRPDGTADPKPTSAQKLLAPDTHSPVLTAGRVFGVWRRLYCLDAVTLKVIWEADDPAFAGYCTLLASDTRVLVQALSGELILLDATAADFTVLGRTKLFPDDRGVYAHPAVVGTTLYLRGESKLLRVEL